MIIRSDEYHTKSLTHIVSYTFLPRVYILSHQRILPGIVFANNCLKHAEGGGKSTKGFSIIL